MSTAYELRKLMEMMEELPEMDMTFFKQSSGVGSRFAPTSDDGVLYEEELKKQREMTCEDGSCGDKEEDKEEDKEGEEKEAEGHEEHESDDYEKTMESLGITMFATPATLGPDAVPGSKASKKRWAKLNKHSDSSKKESVSAEEQTMNRLQEMKRLAGLIGESEAGKAGPQTSAAPKGGEVGEGGGKAEVSKKPRSVGADTAAKAGPQTSAAPKGGEVGEGGGKAEVSKKPRSVGSDSAVKLNPQRTAAPKGGTVGEIPQAADVSRKVRQVEHVSSINRAKALLGE